MQCVHQGASVMTEKGCLSALQGASWGQSTGAGKAAPATGPGNWQSQQGRGTQHNQAGPAGVFAHHTQQCCRCLGVTQVLKMISLSAWGHGSSGTEGLGGDQQRSWMGAWPGQGGTHSANTCQVPLPFSPGRGDWSVWQELLGSLEVRRRRQGIASPGKRRSPETVSSTLDTR